jgi:hypothetical protein
MVDGARPSRSNPAAPSRPRANPYIGASGPSREVRLYDASANLGVEHAGRLSNLLHQQQLTERTMPVEWPDVNPPSGYARTPGRRPEPGNGPSTHTTLARQCDQSVFSEQCSCLSQASCHVPSGWRCFIPVRVMRGWLEPWIVVGYQIGCRTALAQFTKSTTSPRTRVYWRSRSTMTIAWFRLLRAFRFSVRRSGLFHSMHLGGRTTSPHPHLLLTGTSTTTARTEAT